MNERYQIRITILNYSISFISIHIYLLHYYGLQFIKSPGHCVRGLRCHGANRYGSTIGAWVALRRWVRLGRRQCRAFSVPTSDMARRCFARRRGVQTKATLPNGRGTGQPSLHPAASEPPMHFRLCDHVRSSVVGLQGPVHTNPQPRLCSYGCYQR